MHPLGHNLPYHRIEDTRGSSLAAKKPPTPIRMEPVVTDFQAFTSPKTNHQMSLRKLERAPLNLRSKYLHYSITEFPQVQIGYG